jgi:hypothetical protein
MKDTRIPAWLTLNADGQVELNYFVDINASVWASAVRDADEETDPLPLIRLLLTEEMTTEGRALVRDLLHRHHGPWPRKLRTMKDQLRLAEVIVTRGLRKKPGQYTPLYGRSDIDTRLELADAEVRAYRQALGGPVPADTVKGIAAAHDLKGRDLRLLRKFMSGKRGSSRRKTERFAKYSRD